MAISIKICNVQVLQQYSWSPSLWHVVCLHLATFTMQHMYDAYQQYSKWNTNIVSKGGIYNILAASHKLLQTNKLKLLVASFNYSLHEGNDE